MCVRAVIRGGGGGGGGGGGFFFFFFLDGFARVYRYNSEDKYKATSAS